MKKVELAVVAAAPVPPSVVALWQMWGLNLRESLGQTEAGFIVIQRGDFPEPGNAGQPYPGVTIRLSDDFGISCDATF